MSIINIIFGIFSLICISSVLKIERLMLQTLSIDINNYEFIRDSSQNLL